jgi:hypothetical protein
LGMTVRTVFEIPAEEGYTVSDIKIGGTDIEFGGQIAEFIDVKLTGVACREGQFDNQAFGCVGGGPKLAAAALLHPAPRATRYQ